MPAVQISLSGEGSIFYFSFEVLQMCTLWQAWAKSYCLLQVRWSLGDGGKVGAGLIPGVSFFPCVREWMVGTITALWMQALKQLMAEEWHGRNGESDLLFATGHLWLARVHCRLKTFLIKQQTSSLYHSCSLFQAVLGQPHRVHFFFPSLFLCGWCDGEESGTYDPELELCYPQTFSASSASSAGHVNDDGVDAAATVGVPPVFVPCPPHPSTEGQPERCHVQNRIYFCFVFWLRTLPPMTTTTTTTTTKKGQMHFLHFLIISKAMYHCFL